jgi:putative transcriptional regulator
MSEDTNRIKAIRQLLGLSQESFGKGIGCTQSNVGHYEKGQELPIDRAKKLIEFAAESKLHLSLDQVYGRAPLPPATSNEPATSE